MTVPATIPAHDLRAMLVSERPPRLLDVPILDGGITAREANGFAVNRGAPRWDLERQVRLVAGSIVVLSILASIFFPWFKWVAGAVGAGLAFAAVTNTCAMGTLLSRLSYSRGTRCDAQTIVCQLVDSAATDKKAS